MRFAVCDDEELCRRELISLIDRYRQEKCADIIIDTFQDGSELLQATGGYDIIFMDYQMHTDGMKTAERLRERSVTAAIIFVSAYTEAAIEAYEVGAFRFLKKPVDRQKLFRALDACIGEMNAENVLVIKSTDNVVWKIRLSDIVYAEADGKHTIMRTLDNTHVINIALKYIEEKLPQDRFIRCQRAYVVGFEHIKSHTSSEIIFDNGERAVIGKSYAAEFKAAFQKYIIENNARSI